MIKLCRTLKNYYTKNPYYNSMVHFFLGAGVGFLLTYPLARTHPVRWGLASIAIAIAGKLWALKNN